MKKSMCGMLVTFLLVSSVQAQEADWVKQDGDWQKHYVQALAGFERGDYASAAEEFENAIGCEPMPQEGAIDYLPYVHLAVARFKLGQADAARYALTQSHNHGVAANTSRGKSMLAQYSVPIMDTPIEHAAAQELPVQSDFEQMDFALTEQEVEVIRTRVLRRCALSSRVAKNKLPWYFHYEFGVDLMEAGDARMALDALTLGANKREDSRRDSRMYGMWYIDYLPYYQIALANARLGNWENARNAIELSNAFGEFSPEDVDFESFAQLEKLIAQKIEGGGS